MQTYYNIAPDVFFRLHFPEYTLISVEKVNSGNGMQFNYRDWDDEIGYRYWFRFMNNRFMCGRYTMTDTKSYSMGMDYELIVTVCKYIQHHCSLSNKCLPCTHHSLN